jgi:hypothetical protein
MAYPVKEGKVASLKCLRDVGQKVKYVERYSESVDLFAWVE